MRVVRCYSDKLTSDLILLLRAYRTIRKRLSAKRQTAQHALAISRVGNREIVFEQLFPGKEANAGPIDELRQIRW
jgi:hypothetical protein